MEKLGSNIKFGIETMIKNDKIPFTKKEVNGFEKAFGKVIYLVNIFTLKNTTTVYDDGRSETGLSLMCCLYLSTVCFSLKYYIEEAILSFFVSQEDVDPKHLTKLNVEEVKVDILKETRKEKTGTLKKALVGRTSVAQIIERDGDKKLYGGDEMLKIYKKFGYDPNLSKSEKMWKMADRLGKVGIKLADLWNKVAVKYGEKTDVVRIKNTPVVCGDDKSARNVYLNNEENIKNLQILLDRLFDSVKACFSENVIKNNIDLSSLLEKFDDECKFKEAFKMRSMKLLIDLDNDLEICPIELDLLEEHLEVGVEFSEFLKNGKLDNRLLDTLDPKYNKNILRTLTGEDINERFTSYFLAVARDFFRNK